jgi:hypothetical protein
VCTCPPAPVPMYAISSCSWKVLGKHTLVYLSSSSCAGVCDKFLFLKSVGQAHISVPVLQLLCRCVR